MSEITYQTEILTNRVIKRYKHLKKWAKRTNISSFRIYDKDIPEIPLAIDYYEGISLSSHTPFLETFLVFYLYERPYEKDENEEKLWLQTVSCAVATALEVNLANIFIKIRKKQKGNNQYEKNNSKSVTIKINEQGNLFSINLSDYLDTGLFFDHRILRKTIFDCAKDKDILNLFCYTGSFSVYAANGKAKSVTSVDLSNTYINWTKKNFELNGFSESDKYIFITNDVIDFLINDTKKYDYIILDPPTYSNSKKTHLDLDINRDWPKLINLCEKLLKPLGTIYFSTNSKKLVFDSTLIPNTLNAKEITELTIPEDFRNKNIHKCFEIIKK